MCVYPAGCVSTVCISRFKHYSYLGIFSLTKRLILQGFFFSRNFCKSGSISEGYFYLRNGWFYNFLTIFVKWDPLLKMFMTKMWPISEGFFCLENCWFHNFLAIFVKWDPLPPMPNHVNTPLPEILAPKSDRLAYE